MQTFFKEYKNGLRLLVRPMTAVRSVTFGAWVRAGSAYETTQNNGISHFVEHMLFKGTDHRTAFQISKEMDDIGAQINAFTAREYTCYYTKSVDEDVDKCMDLISDMLYHSRFDKEELDRERNVILEEISMVEDSPEDVCQEQLTTAMFGDGTYGQTILGPRKNVEKLTAEDVRAYMKKRYVPRDFVLVLVGNIDETKANALVERYFDVTTPCIVAPEVVPNPRQTGVTLTKKKDIEQVSVALGFPALPYDHPDGDALQIASVALGGGMSSRLFQEVREKKGLAYAVYSYLTAGRLDGTFSVYCGTSPNKYEDAVETMMSVMHDVKQKGLTEEEFNCGKAQIRGSFLFGQESSYTLMNTLGKYMIQTDKIYDVEDSLAKLEAVTRASCNSIVAKTIEEAAACKSVVGRI